MHLSELDTDAKIYEHNGTGAEILFLSNQDENKCFGIAFRTPPQDSTGVAHILEHTVLCGSEKYPVKDPFVQLLKGSCKPFSTPLPIPIKLAIPLPVKMSKISIILSESIWMLSLNHVLRVISSCKRDGTII